MNRYTINSQAYYATMKKDPDGKWLNRKDVLKMLDALIDNDNICGSCEELIQIEFDKIKENK